MDPYDEQLPMCQRRRIIYISFIRRTLLKDGHLFSDRESSIFLISFTEEVLFVHVYIFNGLQVNVGSSTASLLKV